MTDTEPTHCQIAIIGGGLFGALIAMALAELRPEICVMLFEGGRRFGSDRPELGLADEIPKSIMPVLANATVASWDRYFVLRTDRVETIAAGVIFIDPGQMHIDTIGCIDAGRRFTCCSGLTVTGSTIRVAGHRIDAEAIVDVRDDMVLEAYGMERAFHRRDIRNCHHLDAPILADFTHEMGGDIYLEMIPISRSHIDANRIALRPLPTRCGPSASPGRTGSDILRIDATTRPPSIPLPLNWAARVAARIAALPRHTTATIQTCLDQERGLAAQQSTYIRHLIGG